jgi:hypothetical protein
MMNFFTTRLPLAGQQVETRVHVANEQYRQTWLQNRQWRPKKEAKVDLNQARPSLQKAVQLI